MAARALARGMGTFFKDCEHPESRWSKCPHLYKIRPRTSTGSKSVATQPEQLLCDCWGGRTCRRCHWSVSPSRRRPRPLQRLATADAEPPADDVRAGLLASSPI
ncbi:hypothetical protein EOT10_33775 [Streptomyces antnestii]|uniref:Uncharacterized protein n=1 Tax=Streptomyces antnestii TaxID=2494256 RepID=A0A437P5U7_9ACTN|nr:hypothetical protein EOT10_33775 [Streptomyces sp. San01]